MCATIRKTSPSLSCRDTTSPYSPNRCAACAFAQFARNICTQSAKRQNFGQTWMRVVCLARICVASSLSSSSESGCRKTHHSAWQATHLNAHARRVACFRYGTGCTKVHSDFDMQPSREWRTGTIVMRLHRNRCENEIFVCNKIQVPLSIRII